MDLLKTLCLTPGIPGHEHRVRQVILNNAKGLFDDIRTDPLGSLICLRRPRPASKGKRNPKPLKIMLAAHMDQIGFMVKHIDDRGFIRLTNFGGFDPRTLFARHVTICTAGGDIPGVLQAGSRPTHIASEEEKKKVPELNDFFVDVGLPAVTAKKQIKIGDMVVLDAPFTRMGKTVTTRALDNRVACWLVLRTLQQLKHHDCQIHAVFTVQEEVGLRGATTAAYDVKPDIGIGIDSTLAVDVPGVPEDQRVTMLGGGATLTVADSSVISDPALVAEFERIAEKHNIKHQRSILARGGTDTAATEGPRLAPRGDAVSRHRCGHARRDGGRTGVR